jgi:hypothetical protein
METYENNYGRNIAGRMSENLGVVSTEQSTRSQRFPNVEERVDYYMGKWHENMESLSMKREEIVHLKSVLKGNDLARDSSFIASGYTLSQCAHENSSHSEYLRRLCREALPYFDDRNTADLKSNSFKRLLKTKKTQRMKLASHSCKCAVYIV